MVTVSIYAEDSADPYLRDWNIYTSFPDALIIIGYFVSGDTWTVDLDEGTTYYFNVGQSGGPAYGTYSGTINGVPFSGVDVNHAVQFIAGGEVPPPQGVNGKIYAIRVQDIPRDIWYNWDKGGPGTGWTTTGPVGPGPGEGGVTPGSNTLYIAAWAVNEGVAGNLTLKITDDTGAVLVTKTLFCNSGGGVGVEWTGNMPTRNYNITLEVTP